MVRITQTTTAATAPTRQRTATSSQPRMSAPPIFITSVVMDRANDWMDLPEGPVRAMASDAAVDAANARERTVAPMPIAMPHRRTPTDAGMICPIRPVNTAPMIESSSRISMIHPLTPARVLNSASDPVRLGSGAFDAAAPIMLVADAIALAPPSARHLSNEALHVTVPHTASQPPVASTV